MDKTQTEFFNGYVLARIAENLAIDIESLIEQIADETSILFTGKSVAAKHAGRAVNQLEVMGFIEVNDAGNIEQSEPAIAFREMEDVAVESLEESSLKDDSTKGDNN